MTTSREYAKFKRLFVGPIMPRRIVKQRFYSVPARQTNGRQWLSKDDPRRKLYNKEYWDAITPRWANLEKIDEIYAERDYLIETTGEKYEVDHVIPRNHPLVCGLHVETNLRVITKTENNLKLNKFEIE